jgi:hypothetical protein
MRSQRCARTALQIAALCIALAPLHAMAQKQTQPPTLDTILTALEENLHQYHSQVPSFLCDEHAESNVVPGTPNQDTVTDSVFRLKRDLRPDHSTVLAESRDIKTVNGRPASSDEISGPSILSGAFSGALAMVSLSQKACMNYKLRPIKASRGKDRTPAPYVVEFSTVPERLRPANCLLQEEGKGRVFIDPATMQITRMELTAPNHLIAEARTADGQKALPILGPWEVSVDYTPVQLAAQTFWMPATIASIMTHDQGVTVSLSGPRTRVGGVEAVNSTIWSFQATYRNYHKLEVTSRIVPTDDSPAPDPPASPAP